MRWTIPREALRPDARRRVAIVAKAIAIAARAAAAPSGLTGIVTFGPDRRRSDEGLLFRVVVEPDTREYLIRALRD